MGGWTWGVGGLTKKRGTAGSARDPQGGARRGKNRDHGLEEPAELGSCFPTHRQKKGDGWGTQSFWLGRETKSRSRSPFGFDRGGLSAPLKDAALGMTARVGAVRRRGSARDPQGGARRRAGRAFRAARCEFNFAC